MQLHMYMYKVANQLLNRSDGFRGFASRTELSLEAFDALQSRQQLNTKQTNK